MSITAGNYNALILLDNGTVVECGYEPGDDKALISGETTNHLMCFDGQTVSNVISVATWRSGAWALKADHTVVGWGDTASASGSSNIVAISKGRLGLTEGGLVKDLVTGACLSDMSNVVAIASGGGDLDHNLFLNSQGIVTSFGKYTTYSEGMPPAKINGALSVSAGWNHSLALLPNGTVMGLSLIHI